jgi:bifunctional pyridoxal-dependent enzyme with beta-cystathionase and maltose regulon repressor activities
MESIKGGYLIVRDPTLRQRFEGYIDLVSVRVNEFALNCVEVVYSEEGKQWLRRVATIIKTNYDYLQ